MPNYCAYSARIVAKSKETIQRVIDIMRYKDPEYCLHRVFSCDVSLQAIEGRDGLWFADIYGDTAWNAQHLVDNPDQPEEVIGKSAPTPGTENAHCTGFETLCKALDFGIEIWSEEPGCCFQEHLLTDHAGFTKIEDVEEWYQEWEDDEGNELDQPITSGGFPDYLKYHTVGEIYYSLEDAGVVCDIA